MKHPERKYSAELLKLSARVLLGVGGSGGKFACSRCSLAKATGCSQLLGNHSCSIFLTFLEMPFISSSVLYQRL